MFSRYVSLTLLGLLLVQLIAAQFNPSILQDTRNEPKVDGTFGFLYRTEDGIAHAARGDSSGVVQGRFSYTDPTGLKVNYNYNAGSRSAPAPEPQQRPTKQSNQEAYRDYDYSEESKVKPISRNRQSQRPVSHPEESYEQFQEFGN